MIEDSEFLEQRQPYKGFGDLPFAFPTGSSVSFNKNSIELILDPNSLVGSGLTLQVPRGCSGRHIDEVLFGQWTPLPAPVPELTKELLTMAKVGIPADGRSHAQKLLSELYDLLDRRLRNLGVGESDYRRECRRRASGRVDLCLETLREMEMEPTDLTGWWIGHSPDGLHVEFGNIYDDVYWSIPFEADHSIQTLIKDIEECRPSLEERLYWNLSWREEPKDTAFFDRMRSYATVVERVPPSEDEIAAKSAEEVDRFLEWLKSEPDALPDATMLLCETGIEFACRPEFMKASAAPFCDLQFEHELSTDILIGHIERFRGSLEQCLRWFLGSTEPPNDIRFLTTIEEHMGCEIYEQKALYPRPNFWPPEYYDPGLTKLHSAADLFR